MRFMVIASLVGCVLSAPQYYQAQNVGGNFVGGGTRGGGGGAAGFGPCVHGQARNALGVCVDAIYTRNTFVFRGPPVDTLVGPPPEIPPPRVDYNVVFVRTPERQADLTPIVVPPPQQRTIVYVLSKNGSGQQQVIEVPAGPGEAPEVIYVNYNDGDNPNLAGGLKLQEVLAQGGQQGQVLGGGLAGLYGGQGGLTSGVGGVFGGSNLGEAVPKYYN